MTRYLVFLVKCASSVISVCIVTLLIVSPLMAASDDSPIQDKYYVAPWGSDMNDGTIDSPFQTINKAKDVVRRKNKNMTGNIVIFLRGGTYTLTSPLTFDQNDSGTNGFNIIYTNYQGEMPMISGGRQINDWQQDGNKWKAFIGPNIHIRQLFVNSQRAIRARDSRILTNTQIDSFGKFSISNQNFKQWSDIQSAEIVMRNIWQEYRCHLDRYNDNTIYIKQPCFDIARSYSSGEILPLWIENVNEFLDEPGEWYYSKQNGYIYYLPRPDEIFGTLRTVTPVLESLIIGKGTIDNPVKNIIFRGLTFQYNTYLQPDTDEGYPASQSNTIYTDQPNVNRTPVISTPGIYREWVMPPAAVTFVKSQNIQFERNVFSHLGSAGLWITGGSKKNSVIGNVFSDISGNGIQIGDFHTYNITNPRELDEENIISNNVIRNVADEFHGGTGVLLGWVSNNRIAHNKIENLPGAGISIGGWGRDGSLVSKGNAVTNNLIVNTMQEIADQGAVYIPGHQPETLVKGNVIKGTGKVHHVGPSTDDKGNVTQDVSFGDGSGIMLDGGPSGIIVEENALLDSAFVNLLITDGRGNIFRNNFWQDRTITDGKFRCTSIAHSGCRPDIGETWDGNNPSENIFTGNTKITNLREVPSSIIVNAGLEATYTDIDKIQESIPLSFVVPGDLNLNGKVDIFDYNLLVQNFGKSGCGNVADLDANCKVDIFDYNILVGNFGKNL